MMTANNNPAPLNRSLDMAKLTMVEQTTTKNTADTQTMILFRKYRKKSPVRTSLKLSRQKEDGIPHALPKYSFWVLKDVMTINRNGYTVITVMTRHKKY